MNRWICVVETPSGKLAPIVASDEGELATWPSEEAAQAGTQENLLVRAYGAFYLEVA